MAKHIILFLAANPLGTGRLALDQEARAIQLELERSGHRDHFELVTRWAAQPLDLLRELRKLKPTVVHFSGHGRGGGGGGGPDEPQAATDARDVGDLGTVNCGHQHGLFFQGPDGRPQLVSTAALQETFGAAGGSVQLVVLNACYSEAQAEALAVHVGCVVGVSGSIHDDAARSFAIGFYGGLGERESVTAAYRQGRAAISLEGLRDSERPQLKVREGLDADRLVLAGLTTDEVFLPPRRGWTWHSTAESTDAGVVSVLAIIETVAASGVYAWIAWRFGTLHLVVSACVVPFLLLRTQASISLALNWFHWLFEPTPTENGLLRIEGRDVPPSMPFSTILVAIVVGVPCVTLAFLVACAAPVVAIRAVATIVAVSLQPLRSMSEIPRNWWRSTVCVDSCSRLELLHGAYQRYGDEEYETMTHFALMPGLGLTRLALRDMKATVGHFIIVYLYTLSIGIAVLVPALVYRWSLKGTALIYSPLLWIVRGAMARPLRVYLRDIARLAYYRISRSFAVIVLLLFIAKLYVRYAWNDIGSSWRVIPGHQLLDALVIPEAFPPWQIASLVNGLLAWGLYLAADWAVARLESGLRLNEKVIELMLRCFSLMRGVLSVYTILCCIYLAASFSGRFAIPPMGTRILPWR